MKRIEKLLSELSVIYIEWIKLNALDTELRKRMSENTEKINALGKAMITKLGELNKLGKQK